MRREEQHTLAQKTTVETIRQPHPHNLATTVHPPEGPALIDLNTKFIQEQNWDFKEPVPHNKGWTPDLAHPKFGTPGHTLSHTGTNNLHEEQEKVGTLTTKQKAYVPQR